MSEDYHRLQLQTVAESLANISAALTARAAMPSLHDGSSGDVVSREGPDMLPQAQIFVTVLAEECRRLRQYGTCAPAACGPGLAGALEALRAPVARLMTEGW